ncbi:chaperonin 10-like protein [Absidia repens]|uniref:Chaperonin 10-like protein n=1 Tax=Absidia repens TaxID=90262 RepID=A0A1X2I9Z4_9FUNG|nr:chaperonin 10-like protein [Absidia repens]
MVHTDTFNAWVLKSKDQPLEWDKLPLKQFDADTVEMNITHCGMCGTDIHAIDDCLEGFTQYPTVVGHEITGVVTRVGDNVRKFKIGDRVGVGAQSYSCMDCVNCNNGHENLCKKGFTGTYCSQYPNGDKTFGGYAETWRGDQHFVFSIPDAMTNEMAATFFCAGITTYSPLRRYQVKKGDRVAVAGVGGLGHFAILWAVAMDAMALGCADFVIASDKDHMAKYQDTLTHMVCASYVTDFDWATHLSLLQHNGTFILLGAPEADLSGIPPLMLLMKQIQISGSLIGSPKQIEEMLAFAVEHDVKPWITKYNMKDVAEAIKDFRGGKPRYRFVLEN